MLTMGEEDLALLMFVVATSEGRQAMVP